MLRWIRGMVAWVSRTSWFRRNGPRFMPGFERLMRRLTGGRVTASGLLVPSLVLHTIGASTGLPRQTELMYVPGAVPQSIGGKPVRGQDHGKGRQRRIEPGAEATAEEVNSTTSRREQTVSTRAASTHPRVFIVTGSNFAREKHPAWTANLLAHPEATVDLHGQMIPVRAMLVSNEERETMWAYIQHQWPGYRQYEQASGRTLRIFRLTEQFPQQNDSLESHHD